MKRPHGWGSIVKLSGKNRRRPYAVQITNGYTDKGTQRREYIGYFSSQLQALKFLSQWVKEREEKTQDAHKGEILPLRAIFERVVEVKVGSLSKNGLKNKLSAFKHLEPIADMDIKDIKYQKLQELFDSLGDKMGVKRQVKAILNECFTYALKRELIPSNPTKLIEMGHYKPKILRRVYTTEEIELLWNLQNENIIAKAILILIYTGLRINELLSLTISCIDLDTNTITTGSKTEAGRNRLIPINYKIKPLILELYQNNLTYLIEVKWDTPCSYQSFLRRFKKFNSKHGLTHTIHDTRHTFASLLSSSNANREAITKIIGHTNYNLTNQVYTHKSIEELQEAIDSI